METLLWEFALVRIFLRQLLSSRFRLNLLTAQMTVEKAFNFLLKSYVRFLSGLISN